MAVSEPVQGFSAQRRWSIGVNVAVAIVAAVLLVILVNWMASMRNYRRDVTAYGGYGVSERTKALFAERRPDVSVSVLYTPDESSRDATRYLDRVADYFEELRRVAPELKVEYIRTHAGRATLVARLGGTLGGEAGEHQKVIGDFNKLLPEMRQAFDQQADLARTIEADPKAWLANFPVYAEIGQQLRTYQERLRKTEEGVRQFSDATAGVPKYPEATSKISTEFSQLKTELQSAAKEMQRVAALADALGKPDAPELAPLRRIAKDLPPIVAKLQATIGQPGDPPPADVRAALKKFADDAANADKEIQNAVGEADALAKRFPAIAEHGLWSVQSKIGGGLVMQVPMTKVLSQVGSDLAGLRLSILSVLDRNEPAKFEQALRKLRDFSVQITESIETGCASLGELAARITQVDATSRGVLDASKAGFLAGITERVDKLLNAISKLPMLKLANVADEIKEDNVIVIESGKRVRVLKFDQVWPVRMALADAAAGSDAPRSFNGDSAVYSAVLGLTREKPFATVVLVHYEPKPEQRSFMPPPNPPLPVAELAELRKRLDESSFVVKEWELSGDTPAPQPEEGTTNLYVFLPPKPPAPPNPFGGPPPQNFGPKELEKVRAALGKDSRAIFLATWEVMSAGPFGGGFSSPPFGYADYLREQWGIGVETDHRVTWVIPDQKQPDMINVNGERFTIMPMNYFSDHPIGRPFRNSAVKLTNVCPLSTAPKPPAGVTVTTVLEVPPLEDYVVANVQSIIRIVNEVMNPQANGRVQRGQPTLPPPYPILLAAKNDSDGRKIVVFGGGQSLVDPLLTRPVIKQVQDRIVAEAPPLVNVDLFVNSLYWLLGQEKYIAGGPPAAPTIGPIAPSSMNWLRLVSYGIWPALVLAPGLFVWLIRRS